MRIATWNVERLKHKNKLDDICIERRGEEPKGIEGSES